MERLLIIHMGYYQCPQPPYAMPFQINYYRRRMRVKISVLRRNPETTKSLPPTQTPHPRGSDSKTRTREIVSTDVELHELVQECCGGHKSNEDDVRATISSSPS